jgi:hypothetical protein
MVTTAKTATVTERVVKMLGLQKMEVTVELLISGSEGYKAKRAHYLLLEQCTTSLLIRSLTLGLLTNCILMHVEVKVVEVVTAAMDTVGDQACLA